MEEAAGVTPPRLTALADKIDCLTEEDVALLGGVEVDTVKAWRHRGTGPTYIKCGLRALYPVKAFSEWLGGRAVAPPNWTSSRVPL
ncbi:helix-turn-helix transcriptional regulator [Methylibium petroleiphilum]|uniref:helix-turn-helix transcriptional regulator n=1 Tax=Methylibium petroleiphilum TaxID=105560 RepID=UPI003D2A6C72